MLPEFTKISLEKLLVAIPILTGVVAICFDVGYFYSLDINLFTAFSLSEHLVFAIEAVPLFPFMLLIAIILVLLVNIFAPTLHRIKRQKKRMAAFGAGAIFLGTAFVWYFLGSAVANGVFVPITAIAVFFSQI